MGRLQINQHDLGDKEFSYAFDNHIISGGTTEEEIYNEIAELIQMIFSRPATSIKVLKKIYLNDVGYQINIENTVIQSIADELVASNYNLLSTVNTLLSSTHFYDQDDQNSTDNIIGSIIKSPLQLMSETVSVLNLDIPNPNSDIEGFYKFWHIFSHNTFLSMAGMGLFSPDTVAGYPANYQSPDFDRLWFSSNTILSRYRLIECLISGRNKLANNNLIGTELNTVTLAELISIDAGNPHNLVSKIGSLLYPSNIDDDRINYFVEMLLDGYESYYWTDSWQEYLTTNDNTVVKNRLDALINSMINAAEYQLM